MDRFTTALRRATRQKFVHMARTALYFTDPAAPNPRTVRVLVTDRFQALGDLKGTNFNYAEIEAISPKAIFMLSEVTPDRGYIISLEPGVAYRIDHTHEPDDITQKADIIKLAADKTVGFPVPGVP